MQNIVVRVLAGRLKNKSIPLPPAIKGHQQITPQKIKEAAFQLFANHYPDLSSVVFWDLFAGSGQMGFEALSRGAACVNFVEIDHRRSKVLQRVLAQVAPHAQAKVIQGDGIFALKKALTSPPKQILQPAQELSLAIFADPPYTPGHTQGNVWQKLEQGFKQACIYRKAVMVVQAPKYEAKQFTSAQVYHYGKNSLLLYESQ